MSRFLLIAMVSKPSTLDPAGDVSGNPGNEYLSVETSMDAVNVRLPLPQDVSPVFASLPEWIADDLVELLLFALQ